jgi:hypothetical protein
VLKVYRAVGVISFRRVENGTALSQMFWPMIAMIRFSWEGQHGSEKEDEAASVDKGRCPDVKGARARENKDDGDSAETEAKRGSDVSASHETWGDAGRRPEEEKSVSGSRRPLQEPAEDAG